MAVDCLDRPWPRGLPAWQLGGGQRGPKAAPHVRRGDHVGQPAVRVLAGAPAPPAAGSRGAGAPPILVVGNTRDPATPYRWAKALAGDLKSGVLLGWNGDGHTAYMMGSSCIDST